MDNVKGGMSINHDFYVDFGAEPDGPALAHEVGVHPLANVRLSDRALGLHMCVHNTGAIPWRRLLLGHLGIRRSLAPTTVLKSRQS